MPEIPRDKSFDSTLALWTGGYRFISDRCRALKSDVFVTRLLLEKTICMRGRDAAELFYDNARFSRAEAVPPRVLKTLFGAGGVQGLDGEAHRHRKAMFLTLMTDAEISRLGRIAGRCWRGAVEDWQVRGRVTLFSATREVLCRAVCEWAGVALPENDVRRRTAQLGAMIDASAAVGPLYWRGRSARRHAEAWAAGLIERTRAAPPSSQDQRALPAIARHRDLEGSLLDAHVAAVELLNILRPTVAVARYVTFAALALHRNPLCAERIRLGQNGYLDWFAQEVRRYYPFFPFVGARVRDDFEWHGLHFPRGTRVLLDLYGTNHDPRIWKQPHDFVPERFRHWEGDAFGLIPQGGGDHSVHHRCPGEWITLEILKVITALLVRDMRYEVPSQDLRVNLGHMPALPGSRFVISDIRSAAAR